MRPRLALISILTVLAVSAQAEAGLLKEVLEPKVSPKAWFVEDEAGRRWCSFTSFDSARDFSGAHPSENLTNTAWLRTTSGRLDSITFAQVSEDAYVEDRFMFAADGRLTEMRRTGHYINDQFVTVTYAPGRDGVIRPTSAGKAVIAEMQRQKLESYWVEWPVVQGLEALPFRKLITGTAKAINVQSGCTPTPTGSQ